MEPMLPQEGQRGIDDAAFDLVSKASALAGQMNSIVTTAVGTVRCLTPTRTCRGSTGVWSTWSMPYRWHPAGAGETGYGSGDPHKPRHR